jgi:glycosyltransferase involved in cell wall biosynthesis
MSLLPLIDVVVIGLNSEKTLTRCLESVKKSSYPQRNLSLIYADGGSIDSSPSIAKAFGCTFVACGAPSPTPGSQRNAGWRLGSGKYVQFLDSDTIMDPEWLLKAVSAIEAKKAGAVAGDRRELHPEHSVFNWIGDLEWNGKAGESECFGGDVLVARAALEATGGYDPGLIAGEDPELSYRIRRAGYRILKLDEPMTKHDLAMLGLRQYCRRSFRSGHAYAEVHAMHEDFWARDARRIIARAVPFAVATAALPLCLLSGYYLLAWAACVAILLRPRLLLVGNFARDLSLARREARLYAWHASLVVLPQFLGMLRFYAGRALSRPLTNARLLPGSGGKAAA